MKSVTFRSGAIPSSGPTEDAVGCRPEFCLDKQVTQFSPPGIKRIGRRCPPRACRRRVRLRIMAAWVPWQDSETHTTMGLVALADGPRTSDAVHTGAAAWAEEAAIAQALHEAVVAHLTSLYGPDGLWTAGNNANEQKLRVLQLLNMDNQLNIIRAMRDSMSEQSDVRTAQDVILVPPAPHAVACDLPIVNGTKRKAPCIRADEVGFTRCCHWVGQPQFLDNKRRQPCMPKLDGRVARHRRCNAIAHQGAWTPILNAAPVSHITSRDR